MARNEEKAMAMLNRWVKMKREIKINKKSGLDTRANQRPDDPKEVSNFTEAEIWLGTIVKEIIRKVSEIQNGSLGEYKIRELNDSINELLKVKERWETRVTELGGKDYISEREQQQQSMADGGVALPGAEGYKYFGAAKNLPRVREMFSKDAPVTQKTSLKEMARKVDDYYLGLTTTADGTEAAQDLGELEAIEAEAEGQMRNENAALDLQEKFLAKKRRRIELLQTQEKEVGLSKLDISQFKALIVQGKLTKVAED